LTDAKWALAAPLIPLAKHGGRHVNNPRHDDPRCLEPSDKPADS